MRAAVLFKQGEKLRFVPNYPMPVVGPRQVLIKVSHCAICRTDLHVIDAELPSPKLPLILGHEIIGEVVSHGTEAARKPRLRLGERVGTGWLGGVDGTCGFCRRGQENLCDAAIFTGYTKDGGFAEYAAVDEDLAEPIPPSFSDASAAPLMCAGLIGYRAYKMTGMLEEPEAKIGIYGFGAAAHIAAQLAPAFRHRIFAFTRPGDLVAQDFAKSLGCEWAGDSTVSPPETLDAAVIFASNGELVVQALRSVRKGGVVVCGGIHMSDIPSFPYVDLWGERTVRSVANLTRDDAKEFLAIAGKVTIKTHVTVFPLDQAQEAIDALRQGKISGAAVLRCSE